MTTEMDFERTEILSQAEEAENNIQAALNAALDQANKIRSARDRIENVVGRARNLRDADPLPREFTGIVSGYRYGMMPGDARPMHRFEVRVQNVIWLHVEITSDEFDDFIASAQIEGEFMAEALNGQSVTVNRVNGRLIPISLGGQVLRGDKPLGLDKNGVELFRGDQVKLKGPFERDIFGGGRNKARVFTATVLEFDRNVWTFKRADRATATTKIKAQDLANYDRFEKVQ